jgi:cysteine synthase A
MIPGLGAGLRPPLCRPDLIDRCVFVSDIDCIVGCRRVISREGMLVGGSSGGVLMAVDRFQREIPPGSHCVAILPDRGERYLDTVFSDPWVRDHFGESALALEPRRLSSVIPTRI